MPQRQNDKKNGSPPASAATAQGDLRNEVIDRLYEVAIDPTRYEELLDRWESMISPIRKGANGQLLDGGLIPEFAVHFDRAGKFLEHLGDEAARDETSNKLNGIEKSAAFLVGRDLRLLDLNKAATEAMKVRKGDHLQKLPLEPEDSEALAGKILRMLTENADTNCILRARSLHGQRLIIFQLRSLHPKDADPLVVAVSSELFWPERFNELLKSAFALTDAEIFIIRGLTECKSIKEIADSRGRSVETVRAQMRSILGKTETRSQTELVRLTLSMMDITAYTETHAASARPLSEGFDTLKPRPYHDLILPGGRKLEYLILGNPTGRPVLFLPLDYGLTRWPASAEAEAETRAIKVIVPIRAGYGNSTPLPRKTNLPLSTAQDLAALMDHLHIDRAPFLSLGSDIFYTAYFHQLFPERITAAIACAGTLPLSRAEQYERMDKWHRFILASARYTPHLLPFMVRAGFSLAKRLGKHGFVNAVYGDSPADVDTFERPEVFEAMVCGSKVCLSEEHSAHRAFSAEVIAQESTDWAPQIQAMKDSVPLHYINGLHDPQVPAETLREFEQDYPWINFHIYEDSGQLIFFQHWPDVLNLLEDFL